MNAVATVTIQVIGQRQKTEQKGALIHKKKNTVKKKKN